MADLHQQQHSAESQQPAWEPSPPECGQAEQKVLDWVGWLKRKLWSWRVSHVSAVIFARVDSTEHWAAFQNGKSDILRLDKFFFESVAKLLDAI